MSTLLSIANAVVSSINAGTFFDPVVAERLYVPLFDAPSLSQLKVSVVAKAREISNATRASTLEEIAIDIGVQKKVSTDAETDELVNLVEEIGDYLSQKRLDDFPDAAFYSLKNDPVYAPEHLHQRKVFTSVLTVTYRVLRPKVG